MGIRISIGGRDYYTENYSVTEESTPLSADDSTGSVGTFRFEIRGVDNPFLLDGQEVQVLDSNRGSTVGFVSGVQEADNGMVTVSCQSRLGRLNIYDVQAQPFYGSFRDAFRSYMALAEQTVQIYIDDQIADRVVTFPGWYGELWFYLKQMAAAQDCEISLVSGIILLRPLRTREAIDHRDIGRSRTYGGTNLARSVEVYSYDNRAISQEPVYPPGGWSPEVEVLTVGAGETVERVIELSASVDYIEEPVMQTFVSQDYTASSVYTIVGDDGLPIQPAQWRAQGGSLAITINDDTTSLTVTLKGPEYIHSTQNDDYISTYSVALGSDFTGNRYSTLRLIGSGVGFNKELLTIPTGVPRQTTGTEVGVTIDNPFISTHDDAYKAGVKAAKWYAGEEMNISGSVISINKIGDTGDVTYPPYSYDQSRWTGLTYQQVRDILNSGSETEILFEDSDPPTDWVDVNGEAIPVDSSRGANLRRSPSGASSGGVRTGVPADFIPDLPVTISFTLNLLMSLSPDPDDSVTVTLSGNSGAVMRRGPVSVSSTLLSQEISMTFQPDEIFLDREFSGDVLVQAYFYNSWVLDVHPVFVKDLKITQPVQIPLVSSYADLQQRYYEEVKDEFDNQLFGNAAGARVWDRKTSRWYRIRSATVDPGEISFDAEDDLTHFDVELKNTGKSYAGEYNEFSGYTYSQRDRLGLNGSPLPSSSTLLFPGEGVFPGLDLIPGGM